MCNSRALSRICDVSYFKLQLISQVNIFEENFKDYIPISTKNI